MSLYKMVYFNTACVFILLSLAVNLSSSFEQEVRQGCRIARGTCLCGIGYVSEYRYATIDECRKVLKGRRDDACQQQPCLNKGACIQIIPSPGYKCRCEGTNHYGNRCENSCSALGHGDAFPYECIVF